MQGWETLYAEIKKSKKVDFALFNNIFSGTYSLLSRYSTESSIDKNCIALIAKAFLFANTESKELESKYRAMLALTERMLNCCVFNRTPVFPEGTTIYVFESRKDVYIDFANVDESIDRLEKLFEEDFWKNF